MFLLSLDSEYIDSVLLETGCLSIAQIHRLLQLEDKSKPYVAAMGVVKKLCYANRAIRLTEDIITPLFLEQREIDPDMLVAIDIMLDLLKEKPKALAALKAPLKLCFLTGNDVQAFAVAVARSGKEQEVNAYLDRSTNEQTIICHLSALTQVELIKIRQPHFFAISDNNGLRYFKGA